MFSGLIFCDAPSTVDLLAFPAHFAVALDKTAEFLRHQFPMVRVQGSVGFVEVTHRGIDQSCYCRIHVPRHAE